MAKNQLTVNDPPMSPHPIVTRGSLWVVASGAFEGEVHIVSGYRGGDMSWRYILVSLADGESWFGKPHNSLADLSQEMFTKSSAEWKSVKSVTVTSETGGAQ